MKKTISSKQLLANRENAKKGGVKTEEGKEISKMNALNYGIYSSVLFDEENILYNLAISRLTDEYKPIGFSEESVIKDLALYDVKMHRLSIMEESFNYICSIDNNFELIDKISKCNDESLNSELGKAVYGFFANSTMILKYKNIDHLGKIQEYRNILERGQDKCLNKLMKIKGFKRIYG